MEQIDFQYPQLDDPMFRELREEAVLELTVEETVEKALEIMGYAHTLFSHDGDNNPSSFDALTILREAKQGESFRCVEYSILAAGLLWAYGIPARVVGLKTADVETREYGAGHVVVEFWDGAKWITCDVQWGVVPKLRGDLLSAFEFGTALVQQESIEFMMVKGSRFTPDKTRGYTEWVREYLYFYDTDVQIMHSALYTDLAGELKLMLVPEGIKPPEKFQGIFKMNLAYTTNPAEFYPGLQGHL